MQLFAKPRILGSHSRRKPASFAGAVAYVRKILDGRIG
jgi:hypothetical protein